MVNKIGIILGVITLLLISNAATWYYLNEKNKVEDMENIEIAWRKGEDNYRGFTISNFIGAGMYCEPVRIIYNPSYIKEMPTSELIIHNDNRLLGYFLDVEAENNEGDYQMTFINVDCIENE